MELNVCYKNQGTIVGIRNLQLHFRVSGNAAYEG